MIELYYKTKFLSLFYDVKYDVTVYDVPTTMLPFTMNDVPVYDVNIFPPKNVSVVGRIRCWKVLQTIILSTIHNILMLARAAQTLQGGRVFETPVLERHRTNFLQDQLLRQENLLKV